MWHLFVVSLFEIHFIFFPALSDIWMYFQGWIEICSTSIFEKAMKTRIWLPFLSAHFVAKQIPRKITWETMLKVFIFLAALCIIVTTVGKSSMEKTVFPSIFLLFIERCLDQRIIKEGVMMVNKYGSYSKHRIFSLTIK